MSDFVAPLNDIRFTLNHVASLEEISKLNGYQHADPETVANILEEAARFFEDVIAPLDRIGDQVGSVLGADGQVRTPDGFKDAYRKYVDAGWAAVNAPVEWGGGGLPYTVGVVIEEMFKSSNMAFSLCPLLTHGAVAALERHGSEVLQETYLPNLVSGEWSGTMVLTEPHAGSDLGTIRTRAERQDDGTYRIFGTKIFITWGDHDLSENIIHLMIARNPDGPPGTKGISMFLVPKFILDENGNPGERNDVNVVSIEHKLGIHASPTCVLSFGDSEEGAVGYLVGEELAGMRNMFTMMNAARIGVGIEGLAATERAFQKARKYANDRVQGRAVGSPTTDSVPIVDHPDIRRSLLTMKANADAMRALVYWTAQEGDFAFHAESEERRQQASNLLALLTPVVKAWCTDTGFDMASLGVQVHGGMGYIEETGAAQILRDSRISMIYEGTNGIQAIDLVLRKLPLEGGQVVSGFIENMASVLKEMSDYDDLGLFRDELTTAIQGLADTTSWLGQRLADGDLDAALAGATPYLEQFGIVIGGWLSAVAAVSAKGGLADFASEFLADKVNTARFYGEHLLPRANGLIPTIKGGADLLTNARL